MSYKFVEIQKQTTVALLKAQAEYISFTNSRMYSCFTLITVILNATVYFVKIYEDKVADTNVTKQFMCDCTNKK